MPIVADGNRVIRPVGAFDADTICVANSPEMARHIANMLVAFDGVADSTATALLETGAIGRAAKAFELESERAARRLFEEAAEEAAIQVAGG